MKQRKRSIWRVLGVSTIVLAVVAALAVMLAPTLLSGYVRGVIAREVGAKVEGTVSVGEVRLGWTGPLSVQALAIDGGAAKGFVRVDAEVTQGLWALATGDAVDVKLAGSVKTAIGADGSIGLARMMKSREGAAEVADAGSVGAPATNPQSLLAGRKVTIEFAGIDLSAVNADAPYASIEDLKGTIALTEGADFELAIKGDLAAKTRVGRGVLAGASGDAASTEETGSLELALDVRIPRTKVGGLDHTRIAGECSVEAANLPLLAAAVQNTSQASSQASPQASPQAAAPTALASRERDGEFIAEKLNLAVEQAPSGLKLELRTTIRHGSAPLSKIDALVETGPLFDEQGALDFDPSALRAKVDATSVPMAIFQPYAPVIAAGDGSGVTLDFVEDVGDIVDVSIETEGAGSATVSTAGSTTGSATGSGSQSKARAKIEARRVRLAFESTLQLDANGKLAQMSAGVLSASASVRPELLRALGVATETPLALVMTGTDIAWTRGDGASAESLGLRGFSAVCNVQLARSFEWQGTAAGPAAGIGARVDSLRISFDKAMGEETLRAMGAIDAGYGEMGTLTASFSGRYDLMSRGISAGVLDANLGFDPASLERITQGAVRVLGDSRQSGANTNLKVRAQGVEFRAGESPRGSLRLELGGALALAGGETSAVLNDLAVDLALPTQSGTGPVGTGLGGTGLGGTVPAASAPSSNGVLALAAKVDGAQVRVQQTFTSLPKDFADPLGLGVEIGLTGSVDVAGIDPAFVTRLVPSAKDAVGILGGGPLRLVLENRPERVANPDSPAKEVLAVALSLDAPALKTRGSARLAKDAISVRNLEVDGTLTRESIASLPLGDAVKIEPGGTISLRVPELAMTKAKPEGTNDATQWALGDALKASVRLSKVTVRQSPGLAAPLMIDQLDADATYARRDERAQAKGTITLGDRGALGAVAFDVGWKKPLEAKVFAGLEGTIEASKLDVARLEPTIGVEAGKLSGIFGSTGAIRVALTERENPAATLVVDFPKTKADIELTVPATADGRRAIAKGSVRSDISTEAFAQLAGMSRDASRRVVNPVNCELAIISLTIPLSSTFEPALDRAALDLRGAVTPIAIEVTDERGAKTVVSTGGLTIAAKAAQLSNELAISITTAKPGGGTASSASPSGPQAVGAAAAASNGSLDLDVKLRGLALQKGAKVSSDAPASAASTAAPLAIDATLTASAFPSATIDAFGSTGGALARYLGDALDASVVANLVAGPTANSVANSSSNSAANPASGETSRLAAARGTLRASLSSRYAKVEIPNVTLAEGFARVTPEKPMTATFEMSKDVREQLLSPINQVFADVSSGAPARFTLPRLSWPLDGDKRKLDGEFTLETGEVKLVNSGMLSWLLSAVQAGRTDGFEAYIEPLRATITKGRLVYRDFALRAGKTTQGSSEVRWKNSLVFTGDIDLGSTPMRATAITTGVPLSDAGNWSSDARRMFESLGAVSPELLKSLVVGVKLSGPLFDAQGKPAKLKQDLMLPDIGDAIRQNPTGAIEAVGGIIDLFKKKDEKKKDEKPKEKKPPANAPTAPPK